MLKYTSLKDGLAVHFCCGIFAGFCALIFGSPFDVVKTRLMNFPDLYKNPIDCVLKTVRNEGPLAFYNGFTPNFVRLASWNMTMFVTLEKVRGYVFPKKGE